MEKEKIIQQIEQLEEKQVQAILKSDIDTLKSIWSEDLHVNNPFNMVVDREQVIQNIRTPLSSIQNIDKSRNIMVFLMM